MTSFEQHNSYNNFGASLYELGFPFIRQQDNAPYYDPTLPDRPTELDYSVTQNPDGLTWDIGYSPKEKNEEPTPAAHYPSTPSSEKTTEIKNIDWAERFTHLKAGLLQYKKASRITGWALFILGGATTVGSVLIATGFVFYCHSYCRLYCSHNHSTYSIRT